MKIKNFLYLLALSGLTLWPVAFAQDGFDFTVEDKDRALQSLITNSAEYVQAVNEGYSRILTRVTYCCRVVSGTKDLAECTEDLSPAAAYNQTLAWFSSNYPVVPESGQFGTLGSPAEPSTIGYDACNPTATQHLHEQLAKATKVTIYLNHSEYALTSTETTELLALLDGAQSATQRCAPDDCFYLNLLADDGSWLMSLPVQFTAEGIVLLFLKLEKQNAGAPLQHWWKQVSARLAL